jgi:hypothetical protein
MQKPTAAYRERLTPSLWVLVSAAAVAPMASLVLVPLDPTLALAAGLVVAVAVIGVLVALSPVVEVRDGRLLAGRAHIDADHLGEPQPLAGDEARRARGPGLDPRSWMLIRGGVEGIVVVPITDEADPVPAWVISTRTPDRLAAAIERVRVTRRSPDRSVRTTPRGRPANGA